MSFMCRDYLGSLSLNNSIQMYCGAINDSSGTGNLYYRSNIITSLSKKNWKKFVTIMMMQARFKPCIRLFFQNLSLKKPISFDFFIKNICLYEGAFVNPPYVQDYLSRIGAENLSAFDETVERDDGYLLSNTLPAHAREFIIQNNGSKEWFDYDRDKNVVLLSYLYSTSNIHHIVKGSLYYIPATQYTAALRKWDIFVWMRCSSGNWVNLYNTCVEDTSYRKQIGSYDYNNDLFKLVIKSGYITNAHNNYIGLCFHGSRVGTDSIWINSRGRIIFVPEIMNSSYAEDMEWIHIDKAMYNPGLGTFVESA